MHCKTHVSLHVCIRDGLRMTDVHFGFPAAISMRSPRAMETFDVLPKDLKRPLSSSSVASGPRPPTKRRYELVVGPSMSYRMRYDANCEWEPQKKYRDISARNEHVLILDVLFSKKCGQTWHFATNHIVFIGLESGIGKPPPDISERAVSKTVWDFTATATLGSRLQYSQLSHMYCRLLVDTLNYSQFS